MMRVIVAIVLLFGVCARVVCGQGSVTTTYDYDSLGNRISATNLMRLADSRVLSCSPSVALHGERVNIFGRNLPVGDATGITVTFDGITANIIRVSTRVVTVEVPQGAMTGPLVVTLPDASQFDLGTFFIQGVVISPMEAVVSFSQTIQFTAQQIGVTPGTILWELLPLPGGNPDENFGIITPSGVYTPPDISDVTAAGGLIVRATSDALNGVVAFARIGLFGTVVNPSRVVVILPGPGDAGGIPSSVTVAMPSVSIILPGRGELGGLQSNVTVGGPPIAVILPGAGELGGLQPNVTVGGPPVAIILPGAGAVGGLLPNVTVALPPVMLVLPGQGDAGGLQPNTTVAKPPVTVEIENQP